MKWIKGKKYLVLTIVILSIMITADAWFLKTYHEEAVYNASEAAYDRGCERGKQVAETENYNDAYNEGFDNGRKIGYEEGYEAGKTAGKEEAKKEMEEAAVAEQQSNADAAADNASTDQNGETVYVSRTGKIHNWPHCSGMKYYTEMTYDEAIASGYDLCKNCY